MMQTYVAEVAGRAVIAFRAKDEIEAQEWIDTEEAVRSDLTVLENEGRPLWDGETPIVVRAATFAEKAAWTRKSVELSEEEGDYNPNDTSGVSDGYGPPKIAHIARQVRSTRLCTYRSCARVSAGT
jgi:hypothetical protein